MSAAPVIPDSNGTTFLANLNAALATLQDADVHQSNAYTTGGTGSAYTLTPTPALAANVAPVRYNVTASAAGSGAPTLAVSGLAALPLVAYDPAGALAAYRPTSGQVFDVQCSGTQWIVLDPIAKGTAAGGRFRNLVVTYGQSSGTVFATADEVTVSDASGNQTRLSSVSVSAALFTIGAINGTDGSTQTAGNQYAVFIAYNPTTGAVGALISGSATAMGQPATPISGYTQYALASWNFIKQLAPAYWYPGRQDGPDFSYGIGTLLTAHRLFASGTLGNTGTPTWQIEQVRGNGFYAPTKATRAKLGVVVPASALGMIAPNNSYGAFPSITNPPFGTAGGSAYGWMAIYDCQLESDYVYVASSGFSYFFLLGWTINL